MSVYSHVLFAIVPLFALILFGYVAKKTRLLHVTDAPVLNRFVISISLPAFVFHAVLAHRLRPELVQLPFLFWAGDLLLLGIGLTVAGLLRWPKPATGTLVLQTLFGNTGYLGYPICTAILPARLPAAVIIDQLGMSMGLYPGGPILGSIYGTSKSPKSFAKTFSFAKSPVFITLIVAILLRLLPPSLVPQNAALLVVGKLFMQVVALIGGVTVPVVLIAIGLLLRPSSLAEHGSKVAVLGLLKLIALPVIVWSLAKFLFHIHGDMLEICVLQAAMPPSAMATVFSGQYDLDSNLAIASFFALTVVSAATLPLMIGLLR